MKDFLSRESFLLAGIPVLAFMLAFAFEIGYADAFNYSYSFIKIDLKVITVAMFVILLAILPLYLYIRIFIALAQSSKKHHRYLSVTMSLPLPLVLLAYASGFNKTIVVTLTILVIISLVVLLVDVLIRVPSHGWRKAIDLIAAKEGYVDLEGPRPESPPPGIINKLIAEAIIVFIIIVIFGLVRGVGVRIAHDRVEFNVVAIESENFVVLSGYDDRLVLGGVTSGKYNGRLALIPSDSAILMNIKVEKFPKFLEEKNLVSKEILKRSDRQDK